MDTIFSKERITEDDIKDIVANKMEESPSLEFKAAASLENNDMRKNEIGKDVSAFANSTGGGVIIYGIVEKDHVAKRIDFVDGNVTTKEWLETIIDRYIDRPIPDLRIIPIRFENKIEQTVYVVQIPESSHAPHMVKDNRYYKRNNFEAKPMEEHQVRELYTRYTKTDLTFIEPAIANEIIFGDAKEIGDYSCIKFDLKIRVKNISESIELYFKLELSVPRAITDYYPKRDDFNQYQVSFVDDVYNFLIPNTSPLFKNETHAYQGVTIHVECANIDALKTQPIKARLSYSNGIKEMEIFPLKYYPLHGKEITTDFFYNRNWVNK